MTDSHSLLHRFENELVVDEQTIEWTTRGFDFFFRPVGADVRVVWCELCRSAMVAALQDSSRLKRVQERIAKNIELKRLLRFWPLSGERELVLSTHLALMRYQGANFWLRAAWNKTVDRDELLFAPDLAPVLSRLESTDEAWTLLGLIHSEGPLHWFRCSRGDMEELEHVLQACLALYGGSLYISKGTDLLFQWLLHAPHSACEDGREIYNAIRKVLDAHFALKWHPLSRRTCSPQGKPVKRPVVFVRSTPSLTKHERLEALLVWREFLRGKMSEEQTKALLNFELEC